MIQIEYDQRYFPNVTLFNMSIRLLSRALAANRLFLITCSDKGFGTYNAMQEYVVIVECSNQ